MKKITVAFVFLFLAANTFAQDFKKVNANFLLRKVEDAKTELDKLLADPKAQNNPEAKLWTARIYSQINSDSALKAKYPGAGQIGLNAFKEYMQLQPDAKLLSEASLAVVDQLYLSNYTTGRSFFDRQQWDSAYSYFKNSADMGEYITQKNWRNNKQTIDTFTVLFTAYAAQNAKKTDVAAQYYGRLADAKVSGKEYSSIYEFLTKYYLNKKDEANFNKYVAIAKELYPEDTIWKALEVAFIEDNATLDQKLKIYDDAVTAGKMTADEYLSYGNMFANVRKGEDGLDSAKAAEIRKRGIAAFQKAFALDSTNGIAAFNAGVVLNGEWIELRERYDAFRGTAAGLKAKRDEIDRQSMQLATESINWLEKAYALLAAKQNKTKVETTSMTNSARILSNLYLFKRDNSKAKPADYDAFDKKFKFYDTKY